MRQTILSCFTILLSFAFLDAQSLSQEEKISLDKILNQYIETGDPGMAIGVVRKGEIIYEGYAGLADLKSNRPISEKSVFNIASCAKQFTAIAVLQLIEEGKLNLEDDIRQFFPGLLP
ncbi:MAG: serine hydrolase domain-containing protein, partial [Bacteroidota bacterium]